MKKILKAITYLFSFAMLTALVSFSGLMSKLSQNTQGQAKKGNLSDGFLNAFDPSLAHADSIGSPSDGGPSEGPSDGGPCDGPAPDPC